MCAFRLRKSVIRDTEQQLAGLIMDVDLPKRLQAENEALRKRVAELADKGTFAALRDANNRAEQAEKRVAELEKWQKCCRELNVKLSDAYADMKRLQREASILRHELSEQGKLLRMECDEAWEALEKIASHGLQAGAPEIARTLLLKWRGK